MPKRWPGGGDSKPKLGRAGQAIRRKMRSSKPAAPKGTMQIIGHTAMIEDNLPRKGKR